MRGAAILRYMALSALTAAALIGLLGEPAGDQDWPTVLAVSKSASLAASLAARYAAYRLARRWERRGYIPGLTERQNQN